MTNEGTLKNQMTWDSEIEGKLRRDKHKKSATEKKLISYTILLSYILLYSILPILLYSILPILLYSILPIIYIYLLSLLIIYIFLSTTTIYILTTYTYLEYVLISNIHTYSYTPINIPICLSGPEVTPWSSTARRNLKNNEGITDIRWI